MSRFMRRNDVISWGLLAILVIAILGICSGTGAAQTDKPAIVPAIYPMFLSGRDWRIERPELPPMGAFLWMPWSDLEPGPGGYNWGPLDRLLDAERGLLIRLPDGKLAQKPVSLMIVTGGLSPSGALGFRDMAPADLRPLGYILRSGTQTAILPGYDSGIYQRRLEFFIRALGARYDADPMINNVVVGIGLDGEMSPMKTWGGVNWTAIMNVQAAGVEYRFGQLVPQAMRWYAESFPRTRLMANLASAPGRCTWADQAIALGLGLKNAGMIPDSDIWWGNWPPHCGLWEPWMVGPAYEDRWVESKHGGGNDEARLWSLYAGLHYEPDAISLHQEWLDMPADQLWWGYQRLVSNGVWTVLRAAEYPDTGQFSGHRGPWGVGIDVSGYTMLPRAMLPGYGQASPYARQAGHIAKGGALRVDIADWLDLGDGAFVRVVWLDSGKPLQAIWPMGHHTDAGDTPERWGETVFYAPGLASETLSGDPGTDLSLYSDADMWVHRIEVFSPTEEPDATPTPTFTARPTATATAYPTATASPTRTATAKPSMTPTVTRMATATMTPSRTATLRNQHRIATLEAFMHAIQTAAAR